MRFLFVAIGVVLASGLMGQVRPDQFTEETNPTNANFEVYSQKNGVPRRAQLDSLRRYFDQDLTLSGDTLYLSKVTTDDNVFLGIYRDTIDVSGSDLIVNGDTLGLGGISTVIVDNQSITGNGADTAIAVQISPSAGNVLELKSDGLFVDSTDVIDGNGIYSGPGTLPVGGANITGGSQDVTFNGVGDFTINGDDFTVGAADLVDINGSDGVEIDASNDGDIIIGSELSGEVRMYDKYEMANASPVTNDTSLMIWRNNGDTPQFIDYGTFGNWLNLAGGTADGDGIYDGSGIVPGNSFATLSGKLTFRSGTGRIQQHWNGNGRVSFFGDNIITDEMFQFVGGSVSPTLNMIGDNGKIVGTSYSGSATGHASIVLRHSSGGYSEDTENNHILGDFFFQGLQGNQWRNSAYIRAKASGKFTSGNHGVDISIFAISDSTTTPAEKFRIDSDSTIHFFDYGNGDFVEPAAYLAGWTSDGKFVEYPPDSLPSGGSGGDDDWGDQVVVRDTTLNGDGTAGNPLGVDTTIIATQSDLDDVVAAAGNTIYSGDASITDSLRNVDFSEPNALIEWNDEIYQFHSIKPSAVDTNLWSGNSVGHLFDDGSRSLFVGVTDSGFPLKAIPNVGLSASVPLTLETSSGDIFLSPDDSIVFYNKYEFPDLNMPSSAGDTTIIAWLSNTNPILIDKSEFGSSGSGLVGGGIYAGSGNLSDNTSINGQSYSLEFNNLESWRTRVDTDTGWDTEFKFDNNEAFVEVVSNGGSDVSNIDLTPDALELTGSSASNSGDLLLSSDSTRIRWSNISPDEEKSIVMSDEYMIVRDDRDSKGLEYADDYSANFTDRSIPDVAYVDDRQTIRYSAGNGCIVTATGEGITYSKSAGSGTITVPSTVTLISFRISGGSSDLAVGDNSIEITIDGGKGSGTDFNTGDSDAFWPVIQMQNRNVLGSSDAFSQRPHDGSGGFTITNIRPVVSGEVTFKVTGISGDWGIMGSM